jgi:hypothetical protein
VGGGGFLGGGGVVAVFLVVWVGVVDSGAVVAGRAGDENSEP